MTKTRLKAGVLVLTMLLVLCCGILSGCSEQSGSIETYGGVDVLGSIDPKEKAAVDLAVEKIKKLGRTPRIIATSPAIADVCDKLAIELVGVCSSNISTIPERYKDVPVVGLAMSPDLEIVASLKPDWILSPVPPD